MNKYEVETEVMQELADILCDRIELQRVTVVVSGQMKRLRGQCVYNANLVRINANIPNLDEIDDTLRHEIAHMYAWRMFGAVGHGPEWQHACSITGARPIECYTIADNAERDQVYKYKYVCTTVIGAPCVAYAYRRKPRYESSVCLKHGRIFSKKDLTPGEQPAII